VVQKHGFYAIALIGHFSQSSENFAQNCVVFEKPNDLDELGVAASVFLLDVLGQNQIVYLIVNFLDLVIEVLTVWIVLIIVSLGIQKQVCVIGLIALQISGTKLGLETHHSFPNFQILLIDAFTADQVIFQNTTVE
jgi:hypothetical protein